MDWHEQLDKIHASLEESNWIHDRLETLTPKESIILSAAMLRHPPENGADVINDLLALPYYEVCSPAGSYEQLGQYYLNYEVSVEKKLYEYIDMERLGMHYEDIRPGLFIGNCFVQYPTEKPHLQYDGTNLSALKDTGWSVKLKLASEQVPDGVWLRLPDYGDVSDGRPDEVRIALDALGVQRVQECTLLEVKCILPETLNLMDQYQSLADLIYDGQNLGFVLDEQGQGLPDFMERYTAALQYEHCDSLALALDISQNLNCYSYVPVKGFRDFAVRCLHDSGIPDGLLSSGCVDLDAYAESLIIRDGYTLTGDGNAYVARNSRDFIRERTLKESTQGLAMDFS